MADIMMEKMAKLMSRKLFEEIKKTPMAGFMDTNLDTGNLYTFFKIK